MSRCLVTGGLGFIGSNIAKELMKLGHDVVIIDKEECPSAGPWFQQVDVSKPFVLKGKFDYVFHEAAITDPRYENDAELIHENNEGAKNALAFARANGAKFIYASSASIYGELAPPHTELDSDVWCAYSLSKLALEGMAAKVKVCNPVGLRYFNVFGPGEEHKGRTASMIYQLAMQMKEDKNPKIFKWGEQKRDHVYIKDVVKANILAMKAPAGVYNVGTGVATSFNEIVGYLNDALETSLQPEYIYNPYEGAYQTHTQADLTKAKRVLKFYPDYTTKRGIKEYVGLL